MKNWKSATCSFRSAYGRPQNEILASCSQWCFTREVFTKGYCVGTLKIRTVPSQERFLMIHKMRFQPVSGSNALQSNSSPKGSFNAKLKIRDVLFQECLGVGHKTRFQAVPVSDAWQGSALPRRRTEDLRLAVPGVPTDGPQDEILGSSSQNVTNC